MQVTNSSKSLEGTTPADLVPSVRSDDGGEHIAAAYKFEVRSLPVLDTTSDAFGNDFGEQIPTSYLERDSLA